MTDLFLKTKHLTLEPLGLRHLLTSAEYCMDAENTRYMFFMPFDSLEETRAFLQKAEDEWAKAEPAFREYAILLDGRHIGGVSLYPEDGCMEIGWILRRDCQGHGFGLEAAQAAANHALNELGAQGLIAHCDSENLPSRRIMEKLGMLLRSVSGGRKNRGSDEERQECIYELPEYTLPEGLPGRRVSCVIDRPMGSAHPRHPDMIYPVNYGYVPGILAGDGAEQDVYCLGPDGPVRETEGEVIAVYHRFNDIEDKWIVATDGRPHSRQEILSAIRFQEQYFTGRLFCP